MKGHISCFISILSVSLIISCNKQKHYPGDSVTGSNVFGCFINQKKFLPCASLFHWYLQSVGEIRTSPLTSSVTVEAQNKCDDSYTYGRSVTIHFSNVQIQENVTYKFGRFEQGQVSCVYSEDLNYFYSDSIFSGSITIRKLDPVMKILSANFDAVLKQRDSLKTITVTNGTFDVKLQ